MRRRRGPSRATQGSASSGYTSDIYGFWQARFAPAIPDIMGIQTKNRPNLPHKVLPAPQPGRGARDTEGDVFPGGLGQGRPEYDAARVRRREAAIPRRSAARKGAPTALGDGAPRILQSCAAVSCLRLVIRVRRTATTFLN